MPMNLRAHFLRPSQNFTQLAYRYGIGLSCIGVILNWLGVADSTVHHVRYLGVFLVIVGSFLIVASMCHWMVAGPQSPIQTSSQDLNIDSDLQVISTTSLQPGTNSSNDPGGNPPDYNLVVDKPPSYEQAMTTYQTHIPASPTSFTLQSDSSLPPYSSRFDVMAGYDREVEEISISQKNIDTSDSTSLPSTCTSAILLSNCRESSGPFSLDNLSHTNRSDNHMIEQNSNCNSYNSANELVLEPQSLFFVHSSGRSNLSTIENASVDQNSSDCNNVQSSNKPNVQNDFEQNDNPSTSQSDN